MTGQDNRNRRKDSERKKPEGHSRLFIAAVVVCGALIAGLGAVHSHAQPHQVEIAQ
ncbi:MAG: hypothetical protein KDK24_16100 [Pseudooceanicola sp.]|nr:hypothetical protein [Pseudooceanicola sp.]